MTHIQILTKQTSARDYIKRNAPSAVDQDHKHSPYSSQRWDAIPTLNLPLTVIQIH